MKQWSSAVPLLAIVFASGYLLGRNSPAYPLQGQPVGRAMSAHGASPDWHGPVLDPSGRWILPGAGPQDARPQTRLPPGHPAVPDDALEDPTVDELSQDGIERNIVVRHPREPIRT